MSLDAYFSPQDRRWLQRQLPSFFEDVDPPLPELQNINDLVDTRPTPRDDLRAIISPVLERLITRVHQKDPKSIARRMRKVCRNIIAMEDHVSNCRRCAKLAKNVSNYFFENFPQPDED